MKPINRNACLGCFHKLAPLLNFILFTLFYFFPYILYTTELELLIFTI